MKVFKKQIIQILAATIFSFALLFPSFLQFAHTFEDHKHEVCSDFSTHFHEKQLDCSVCYFHFSIFNFTPQQFPAFVVIEGFQKKETVYLFPEFNQNTRHYFLRGSPLFS